MQRKFSLTFDVPDGMTVADVTRTLGYVVEHFNIGLTPDQRAEREAPNTRATVWCGSGAILGSFTLGPIDAPAPAHYQLSIADQTPRDAEESASAALVGNGEPAEDRAKNDRVIEFHLEEIDAWRSGQRASPGCPATGERYAARMTDAVWRHELALIALGHQPTIEYVAKHGMADGQRGTR